MKNIEIKVKIHEWNRTLSSVEAFAGHTGITLSHFDTFFAVPVGRLKLRCIDSTHWELIYYWRADSEGPKISRYFRIPLRTPRASRWIIRKALRVKRVVYKERILFLVGDVRIHLDRVSGLGEFLELEVPVAKSRNQCLASVIINRIVENLGVQHCDYIKSAYADLFDSPQTLSVSRAEWAVLRPVQGRAKE